MITTNEQKRCNTYRELIGIVYTLLVYEYLIIGSDHFINIWKDHFSAFFTWKVKSFFNEEATAFESNKKQTITIATSFRDAD